MPGAPIAFRAQERIRYKYNGIPSVRIVWRKIVKQAYDIFRKLPDGAPIWIEAVHTLECAHLRLEKLNKVQPGDYFVYDLSRGKIMANAILRGGTEFCVVNPHP